MPPPDHTSRDRRWAQDIREGDHAAFRALFRAYYRPLHRFARHYVHAHDVAEDLVQDVFFNIWNMHEDWEVRGTVRAYLHGAVRKRAFKYLRHQRVEKQWQTQAQPPGPVSGRAETDLRQKELQQAVQDALAELPERRRLIYTLSRQHDLTYAEIAAVLDISVKTVETQMSRALRLLRDRLSTHLPGLD